MWGNLRESIATAKDNIQTPGSLIAKIGDVVAPLEEGEEYEEYEEYESGSSYYEEEEEVEYYEEEEVEEEEDATTSSTESPSKRVGTLFGQVLNKAANETSSRVQQLVSSPSRIRTSNDTYDEYVNEKEEQDEIAASIQDSFSDNKPPTLDRHETIIGNEPKSNPMESIISNESDIPTTTTRSHDTIINPHSIPVLTNQEEITEISLKDNDDDNMNRMNNNGPSIKTTNHHVEDYSSISLVKNDGMNSIHDKNINDPSVQHEVKILQQPQNDLKPNDPEEFDGAVNTLDGPSQQEDEEEEEEEEVDTNIHISDNVDAQPSEPTTPVATPINTTAVKEESTPVNAEHSISQDYHHVDPANALEPSQDEKVDVSDSRNSKEEEEEEPLEDIDKVHTPDTEQSPMIPSKELVDPTMKHSNDIPPSPITHHDMPNDDESEPIPEVIVSKSSIETPISTPSSVSSTSPPATTNNIPPPTQTPSTSPNNDILQQMMNKINTLQQQLIQSQDESTLKDQQYQRLLQEATHQSNNLQDEHEQQIQRYEQKLSEVERRHAIALERAENKGQCAILSLDEKDNEICQLNTIISDMRSKLKEHTQQNDEMEEDVDDLLHENEGLKVKIEQLQKDKSQMKTQIKGLKQEESQYERVQMELQTLREERARDKVKLDAALESNSSTQSTMTTERDKAKAESLELQQRLDALQADLDIVKADYTRSTTANDNLQRVMEAFQQEREAELELLEESRVSADEAIKASYEISLQALREEQEQAMADVQAAAGKAVQNSMREISEMERKLDDIRKENSMLRRSLDEAIHRLQRNQEDVIDRAFMKNILLDWYSKNGKARREVMNVMASALHFTEVEKDKCGIGENSAISKVAGMVAPPLDKRMIDIEGDSVSEKWVSFLMAECGEEAPPTPSKKEAKPSETNNNNVERARVRGLAGSTTI